MGFFKNLFTAPPTQTAHEMAEADVKLLLSAIGEQIIQYQEGTGASWLHILPAVQKLAVKLMLQSRGLHVTMDYFASVTRDVDSLGGAPVSAHLGFSSPPIEPSALAAIDANLSRLSNDFIGKGRHPLHVALALSRFVLITAANCAKDHTIVKAILADTARDLNLTATATHPRGSKEFRIVSVSTARNGKPLVHIAPAPIGDDGIPELSLELADLLAPYFDGSDNVAVRFVDQLPTTTTAVVGMCGAENGGVVIQYKLRNMIFATGDGRIGCNIVLTPIRRDGVIAGVPISQTIPDGKPIFFKEVYKDVQESRDDLSRLVMIAHNQFRNAA